MKTTTILSELNRLETAVKELQNRLSDLYGDELTQEPAKLSRGLRFNTDTDLFSEEEIEANKLLDKLIIDSMNLERELDEALSNVTRAVHNREFHYTSIIEEVKTRLDEEADATEDNENFSYKSQDFVPLYKKIDELFVQVKAVSEPLGDLSKALQTIACHRYFDSLTFRGKGGKNNVWRAINAEVKEIASGRKYTDENGAERIKGSFDVIDNRNDDLTLKLAQFFEAVKAVNLVCFYSNDYYTLRFSAILPTRYEDISEDKQKGLIREVIEPCFKSHMDALESLKMHKKDAEGYIEEAVDSIYSRLNITLNAEAVPDNAVEPLSDYWLVHTQITNSMFSGEPLQSVERKEIDRYKEGDKTISNFVSWDLNDVEGIDWHGKELTLEEQGILSGIFTQQLTGNMDMSNRMVKKARYQKDGVNLTKKEDSAYDEAWKIFNNISVTIDQTSYMGKVGKDGTVIDSPYRTGKVLEFDIKHDAPLSKQNVKKVYSTLRYSPILQHMLFTGQYTRLPNRMAYIEGLQAKDLWIRDYIIMEIHRIKGDILNTETAEERKYREARERKKAEEQDKPYKPRKVQQQPTMLFEKIYSKSPKGYPKRAREKADIQKNVQLVLKDFKAKGLIKDYTLLYEGINRQPTKKQDRREKSTLATAVKLNVRKSEPLIEEL